MPYGINQSALYGSRGIMPDGNMFRNRSNEQQNTNSGNPGMPIFNTPRTGGTAQQMQTQAPAWNTQQPAPLGQPQQQAVQSQAQNPWGIRSPTPINQNPQQMQAMQGQLQNSQFTPNQLLMNKYYGVPLSYYQNGGQNAPPQSQQSQQPAPQQQWQAPNSQQPPQSWNTQQPAPQPPAQTWGQQQPQPPVSQGPIQTMPYGGRTTMPVFGGS